MARTLLRRLAASAPVARAVALAERLDSAHPRVLRVLTYHRVDEPAPFAAQMVHLAERYRVVSVARVLATMDGGPPLPARAVLLTFDDAYRSFAEVAWPILVRHSLPAALFVPTAYPGGREKRFWWDRLEQAFARTQRRSALATPVGLLALATAEERTKAHALVKRHVKDLPHAETLAVTDEICQALGLPAERHEVLDWDELRALARAGVTLGAHTRTHPRLDRVERSVARAEILGSLVDLEREVPGLPRVFAYPDGRFDDELVALLRAAGVELAFTTRRGTNDVLASDRLRLRRVNVDARDSVPVLRAKLAASAARLAPLTRLLDPPSSAERREERRNRRERRRSRLVLRSLDSALTAPLRPRPRSLESLRRVLGARTPHYERLGRTVGVALARAPALRERLARSLLELDGLPIRPARVQLAGFGSGSTVFRLEPESGGSWALKVYRRTLGRDPARLAGVARRYRERYRRLREGFGEIVLPTEFLVLAGPLRGAPAVAALQPWLEGRLHDVLALPDAALLALLRAHDGLEERFALFCERALAWKARGIFPDLLGRANLVVEEIVEGDGSRARLRLIDYGIFHPSDAPASGAVQVALEALAGRLEALLARIRSHVVVP
jgi:peptidoglycan/xylan/chitin deacetylase (PgdA/CDA1 family)